MSLRCHSDLTLILLRFHFGFTSMSLRLHFELPSVSLRSDFGSTSMSLRCHFGFIPVSLRFHPGFTSVSRPCHFDVTSISLCREKGNIASQGKRENPLVPKGKGKGRASGKLRISTLQPDRAHARTNRNRNRFPGWTAPPTSDTSYANIWKNIQKMFWIGQKYILKQLSKNCFGWAKNTYSKNCQKMVAGCPEGYAIDILKKLCLNSISMAGGH